MTQHLLEPRQNPELLSIVMPVYNEEAMAPILRRELTRFLPTLPCPAELVLVNDGSRDGSLSHLVAWAREDDRVHVLHLSRNFGHQLAATAGLEYARGQAILLMDADLQDPLEVIPAMLARYREGYDVAYGKRRTRQGESWFKQITAWGFYRLMQKFVHKDLPVDTGDFRLMSQRAVGTLRAMPEEHRFLRGMVAWIGYPQIAVEYDRHERAAGETKYPLSKMLRFAWTAATSFSDVPLQLSFFVGAAGVVLAAEEAIRALIMYLRGETVPGWTSLLILNSLLGGLILLSLGVIGNYVGKIYMASKERPNYVVAQHFHFTVKPENRAAPPRD